MIFLWWLCGAAVLFAVIVIAAISAGVVVQLSADASCGCCALNVTIFGVQALRIKLFECGGAAYYMVNNGELKKAGEKKRIRKGKEKRRKSKSGKIALRSMSVNMTVGTESAATTAAMSALFGDLLADILQKHIKATDCKCAVNAEYGSNNIKMNACAVAGWRTLFTLKNII